MVDRRAAMAIIRRYRDAWVGRDPDAAAGLFTQNARYHERVLSRPLVGRAAIRRYWQKKVVGEQERIRFRLLSLYLHGSTVIAEWDVRFHDRRSNDTVHMREVAIIVIRGGKISSLREYWSSEHIS